MPNSTIHHLKVNSQKLNYKSKQKNRLLKTKFQNLNIMNSLILNSNAMTLDHLLEFKSSKNMGYQQCLNLTHLLCSYLFLFKYPYNDRKNKKYINYVKRRKEQYNMLKWGEDPLHFLNKWRLSITICFSIKMLKL